MTLLTHSAQTQGLSNPPSPLLKVRWLLLVIFAAAMIGVFFRQAVATANPGWDFEHYYAGAQIVRAGLGHSLYDIPVQHDFETRFAHGPGNVFNYPAATVLLFLPLSFLSLNVAFLAWTAISMAVTLVAVWTLARTLRIADPWWPMFVSIAFYPLQYSLLSGQVDSFLLLAFVISLAALSANRLGVAGLALALGLIKFHLVLPFVFVMLLRRQWKFIAGFTTGAVALLGIGAAVAGAAQFTAYPRLLLTMQALPTGGFYPSRMPNLRGLIFFCTMHEAPWWLLAVFAIGLLAWSAVQWRNLDLAAGFSLALTAALLATYHVYVHDLVLLLIPLTLLATRTRVSTPLKATIFALLAVPALPYFVTSRRISAILALPLILLLWALFQSRKRHTSPIAMAQHA